MALDQETQDKCDRIDTETNNLADVLKAARDAVKTGMNAENVAIVHGNLDMVLERLKIVAADPEQPVPEDPTPTFSPLFKAAS